MRILVSDPLSEQGVNILRESGWQVDIKTKLPIDELIKIISDYDGLLVRSETKVTKDVIAAASKLKVIGRAGVGVDNIDVEAATQKGIIVLNAPDGNTIAATEHSVALLMAVARNIPQAYSSMCEGKWERGKFTGVEVKGKVLGVLGLGRIGTGVAKRMLAMEMKVLGYDPFISEEHANSLGIELAPIERILQEADFLSLHLPMNNDTRNLIDSNALTKMKNNARIVNCARGGIVNEEDLATALNEGKIAAAAIDVFSKEPINADNPLLTAKNIIFTPHLGASTEEAQLNVAVDVAYGVISALRGEPVATAVNLSAVPSHVLDFIKPYLVLAEKMGILAIHLADGRIDNVTIQYNGEIAEVDTGLLTIAVLKGLLNPILQEKVNYVNAVGKAKQRGIKIKEVKNEIAENFANLVTIKVKTEKREHVVSGTLFGKTEPRIVAVDIYGVDFAPEGWILLCPHDDKPGVIGRMGTILGEHGINIASMMVGRTSEQGKNMMAMSVEKDIPTSLMIKIKAMEGILGAKLIDFSQ